MLFEIVSKFGYLKNNIAYSLTPRWPEPQFLRFKSYPLAESNLKCFRIETNGAELVAHHRHSSYICR